MLQKILDADIKAVSSGYADLGWDVGDARLTPYEIRTLLKYGVIEVVYQSGRKRRYRIRDQEAVEAALEYAKKRGYIGKSRSAFSFWILFLGPLHSFLGALPAQEVLLSVQILL